MSDETKSAEYLRGAREALTRLASWHGARVETVKDTQRFMAEQYPAPRVRATVPDDWRRGKWELYREEWHYSAAQLFKTPVFPSREEVAAMYALQQRADAEGFVSAEEGLGAAAPNSERGAGEPPSASAAAPTIQRHSPAPPPALNCQFGPVNWEIRKNLTFAPREWWLNSLSGAYYHSRESALRNTAGGAVIHVREVRPLTAAQVEALAQAIASPLVVPGSVMNLYRSQARAALRHLNIPYEET